MEEENATGASAKAVVVGVKSWVAYLGTALTAALLFGVALPLTFHFLPGQDEVAGAVMLVSAAIVGYKFLSLRSVQLYYDDIGVWVFSGILPWKKGVSGVKWRDMDEAIFEQSFWSWLSRSYTVRIGHRYTKESEIMLTNIGGGKDAVAKLNAQHQAMLRSGVVG